MSLRDLDVILVVSDVHLGRDPGLDTLLVDDLTACLRMYGSRIVELVLLGDVFDSYMEYPGRADPIIAKLSPLLEEAQFRGIKTRYFVGNHDPWHLDHLSTRYELPPISGPLPRLINRKTFYFSHGDAESCSGALSRIARYFMRSPLWYVIYRRTIPVGLGQRLPRLVSRKFAGLNANPVAVRRLADSASDILNADDIDVVVMGHAHEQADIVFKGGRYFNTGSWYIDRSYLEIGPSMVSLRKWQGDAVNDRDS